MKDILVVDDDILFLKSTTRALETERYDVDQAKSGKDALEKLADKAYDLVILDYKMPGMNGLDVLKTIQKKQYDCAVILITAYGTFEVASEALKNKAVTILSKPVELQRLREEVKRIIQERILRQKKTGSKNPDSKTEALKAKLKQMAVKSKVTGKKNILVVDDSKFFRKYIITTTSSHYDSFEYLEAEDGVQALELLKQADISLIILDINMPHMTGIEFMKLKSSSPKFKQIPVIMLTSEKPEESMEQAYLAGVTVYLNKPLQREKLLQSINTMLYWDMK